eukprot:6552607-Pyramimonas_sp.AAC.1
MTGLLTEVGFHITVNDRAASKAHLHGPEIAQARPKKPESSRLWARGSRPRASFLQLLPLRDDAVWRAQHGGAPAATGGIYTGGHAGDFGTGLGRPRLDGASR